VCGANACAEGYSSVDSTPTFLHQREQYKGALSIEEMSAIIDGML
jgi:protein-disulfide isomerase